MGSCDGNQKEFRREWLPKGISGLVICAGQETPRWGKPRHCAVGWGSIMGRVRVMVREGRRRRAEEVHVATERGIHCPWGRDQLRWGSCLPAPWRGESLPEKAKPGNWGCHGRVQAAEGEGQAKCLGGSLGHAWWIGPKSPEEGQGWGKRHKSLQSAPSETALMSWSATYE